MQNLPKHTQALLALSCVLASILISGRPLPVVKAAESSGMLDTTFGTGGKVTTDFAGFTDQAFSVAVQPDRKIVTAGAAGSDFGLARYNSDGTLDTTFGTGGKVVTDFAGGYDEAHSVAVQRDGKIVVVGSATIIGTGLDFALARYNSDGTLDTSFGTSGKVTTDYFAGSLDVAFSVAVQRDGKIVAAGVTAPALDFALARYNSDGTLDTSFGTGGKVTTDFASGSDEARSVAVQQNGKIVAAGTAFIGVTSFDFALARYNSDGTLDTCFGTGGKVTTDFAGSFFEQARSVAVQNNGKIVAAGTALFSVTGSDFALARYNRDGTLDTSFGTGGKVTTDFTGSFDEANSIAVQQDGKIVAAGIATDSFSGAFDFALARYE